MKRSESSQCQRLNGIRCHRPGLVAHTAKRPVARMSTLSDQRFDNDLVSG
jgi:hypothetical protein